MRRWWPWALLLLVGLGGAGGYLYNQKMETGEIARAVWQELRDQDNGAEAESDPLFRDLKADPAQAATASGAPGAAREVVQAGAKPPVPNTGTPTPVQKPDETPAATPSARAPTPDQPDPSAGQPAGPSAGTPSPAAAPRTAGGASGPAPRPAQAEEGGPASPAGATGGVRVSAPTPGRYDADSPRPNPFSNNVHILLIGNDQERIGEGRADSIMLLTLNPDRRLVQLISIPRDTRLAIPGYGMDKVNHAYRFGGASLLNRSLQRFLGFPFQYYVEISYGGFRQMIDQVGGVDVNVPFSFYYEGVQFEKGPMRLDGTTALKYSRMRKLDPRGDFGREDRHQQIVRALLTRLANIPLNDSVRLNAFARELIPYVRTDLGPMKIVTLRQAHPYADQPPARLAVSGHGQMIGGIYYFIVSGAERRRLHLALR